MIPARRFVASVVVLASLAAITYAHAAPRPKPGADSAVRAQAPQSMVKPARSQAARLKASMQRARERMKRIEERLALAKNAEQSVRRRYEGRGDSQARNVIRRATLERANLENDLSDAAQRYQNARSSYRAARETLRSSRKSQWQNAVSRQGSAVRSRPKGRKLTFASAPLGPTGSGNPQPTRAAKGVLKTRGR